MRHRSLATAAVLACASLAGTLDLRAQQSDAQPPIEFQFQAISLGGTLRSLFYRSDDEDKVIWIPNGGFSRVYEFKRLAPLVIFRRSALADGGYQRDVIGRMPVTPAMHGGFYRLLVMRGDNGQLRIESVDFSDVRAKEDSYFLVNLCSEELAIRMGPTRFRLAAGERRMMEISPDENGLLPTLILRREQGEYSAQYEDDFMVGNGNQGVLIIYSDPQRPDLLHTRLILTSPEPPEAPASGAGD